MNFITFTECFKKLCLSFDLDFDKKKDRIETYFDSKLGELSEKNFFDLLKKAKEQLNPKHGYLPPIRDLISLYYSANISEFKIKTPDDMENFHDAECAICGGTGYVSLQKDGYTYGGYCCTCIKGERRNQLTTIGRKLGFYTAWLEKGFSMIDEGVPF